MPLTKRQKQLHTSIAHARTFRHSSVSAESSRNSTPASGITSSFRTEDLIHPTPPASPEPDLNDDGIFLDVIEEESEQLLEDHDGNHLLGAIEANSDDESQDEDEIIELQGEELVKSLRGQMEAEIALERQHSKEGLGVLMQKIDGQEWEKAESKRSLGYNGLSKRTERRHRQAAREKEVQDEKMRNS